MATSGRRAAALFALVLASTVACSPARPAADTPSPAATVSSRADAGQSQAVGRFCPVELPKSWRTSIAAAQLPIEAGEQLQVAAGSDDRKQIFAMSVVPGQRRDLVELTDGGRRRAVIHRFDPRGQAQVGEFAAFDGRYLAYTASWSFRDYNDWTIYLWDSQTRGEPREIGRSVKAPNGDSAPGPFNYLVAHAGKVAWAQGSGAEDAVLHVYSIAGAQDRVVHRGQISYPIRMGAWLVWPESAKAGEPSKLQALDLTTEQRVQLPKVMADITGLNVLFADARTVVWSNSTWTELSVWRTNWPAPVVAVKSPEGQALQRVHVAGDVVTWDNSEAQFALDLRSGGYAKITSEWGSNNSWGAVLHVGFAPTGKGGASAQAVLDTTQLPALPGCS